MKKDFSKPITFYSLAAVVLLISAYLFYLFVRGFDPVRGLSLGPGLVELPSYLNNSYATFAHVLALSLLCYVLLGARQKVRAPVVMFWGGINLLFEMLQLEAFSELGLMRGTFDPADVMAIVLAMGMFWCFSVVIGRRYAHTGPVSKISAKGFSGLLVPLVGVFGVVSIMASSSDAGYDYWNNSRYEAVYLSYEELRGPLQVEQGRGLQASGKIYLFNDLLIVSEPNKGIHIYDNTDNTAPVHKGFIKLAGNLDIAVRNSYLYADSFIDLVVINISDLNNITVTHREESVFPYDPYQAIDEPEQRRFNWDESKGVVIGVKQRTPEMFN